MANNAEKETQQNVIERNEEKKEKKGLKVV